MEWLGCACVCMCLGFVTQSLWLDKLFKIGDDLRLKYPDKVKASELKSKQPKAAAKVHRDEEKVSEWIDSLRLRGRLLLC